MFYESGCKLSAILTLPVVIVASLDVVSFDLNAIVISVPTITLVVNVWQSLVAYTIVDLSLGRVCR